MAQITIDTTEILKSGQTINTYANNAITELNVLFKRIEEVPTVSYEWVGSSSERFSNLAKVDKVKYYKFIDDLNSYSKFLCGFSEAMNNTIVTIRDKF